MHSLRRLFRVVCPLVVVLFAAGSSTSVAAASTDTSLRDRYVVVFAKGTSRAAARSARDDAKGKGAQVHFVYEHALQGFAATLPARALEGVRRNPHVASVTPDAVVTAWDTQSPATWGLDRVDQRNRPLSNSYTYTTGASNVTAYVVDTGIRFTHAEFGGRALSGYDAVDGGAADDCNGHGTHVAGTIGGSTYGVAKQVRLVAVRVLGCDGSGTTSGVVAGIDWVAADHAAGAPAVANMSLGGGADSAIDTAVANAIADGVTFAVAAGNEKTDACRKSPARVAAAVTVGATTSSDARASYSNYGTCLDLFAPGSSITSAWLTDDTATNTISGTSMATPHVAGAAALYLAANPAATPSAVRDALVATSTGGVLTSIGSGSPNRLLYTLGTGVADPTPTPAPSTCASLPQQFSGSLSGSGASQYQPGGTYYYSSVSGTHAGCLDGPDGVDFDLYLQKWNGSRWVDVASGVTTAADESVRYTGTAGYYTWKIVSYSGSGSYAFGMAKP